MTKKKVIVYVVKDEKLLVFRHVDFSYEEVGVQVPGGTILFTNPFFPLQYY